MEVSSETSDISEPNKCSNIGRARVLQNTHHTHELLDLVELGYSSFRCQSVKVSTQWPSAKMNKHLFASKVIFINGA